MRKISLILLMLLTYCVRSQDIIIQPPIITPFECTEFYKLYTGVITNFSSTTFETRMVVEVDYTSPSGNTFRLADGILSSSQSTFFSPGVTMIDNGTYERLFPTRNITFYDREMEALIRRTQCLPPGQYDVCLSLIDVNEPLGSSKFLTQTCYTREKQMLTSLLLVSPFENEEIKTDMPLFTWTPITPFNPRAVYRIQMVEILANQTPFEAFRANPIFFEQTGLASNIFQYPVAARTMLPCTKYAWRVTYELAGGFGGTAFKKAPDFLQESEIWEFSRPCEEEEEEVEKIIPGSSFDVYHDVKIYAPNAVILVNDYMLRLLIDNSYETKEEFTYQIINKFGGISNHDCCWTCCDELEGAANKPIAKSQIKLKQGTQKLRIDLEELGLIANEMYSIRLNVGKESKEIKFKIVQ
ncbi:MAG: hypothetical protein KDC49_12445 [Saprospiraceae bacterium]|nr:hypothetical protein [Saprospiraceae bacterium]